MLSFIIIFLAFSGWYIYSLYEHVNETMDDIYIPIEKNPIDVANAEKDKSPEKLSYTKIERNPDIEEIKITKPLSLLILGIDGNGEIGNRSDAIIVMTINPKDKKKTFVSIPRDTRVMISGKNKLDKINHAYAYGGPQMAIDTVENYLDIPIDYFISINMKGFEDTVNLLGGIKVYNAFAFTEKGMFFPKGELSLDGKRALAFARMRKSDPLGDVGRNERQQLIIQAVMDKGSSVLTIPKTKQLLNVIRENIKTNLTLADIKILKQYHELSNKKEVLTLNGKGEKIDHIWYYTIPESERQKVIAKLHTQLQMN